VVSADGRPANPEDLLIAYALGVPYTGQHGDDQKRWEQCFGDLAVDPADSLGMAPAPPAGHQAQLDWARGLCDAAMDAASRRGVRVAVAVVDRGGDPVQQDLMDGAPAGGGWRVAQAVAGAAALFDCWSGKLGARFRPAGRGSRRWRRWWLRRCSASPAGCRSATAGTWWPGSASAAPIPGSARRSPG